MSDMNQGGLELELEDEFHEGKANLKMRRNSAPSAAALADYPPKPSKLRYWLARRLTMHCNRSGARNWIATLRPVWLRHGLWLYT